MSDLGFSVGILLTIGVAIYLGVQIFQVSDGPIGTLIGLFARPVHTPIVVSAEPADTPVATPPPATSTPTPPPSPTPQPTAVARLRIAHTGGAGAYLRRTPNLDDRLRPWPDNTILEVVGPDVTASGMTWKHVKDPQGTVGYVPIQWTAPAQ